MGRFLKPDSVVANAADPQSWNLYAYVRNNPANLNDPTGHLVGVAFKSYAWASGGTAASYMEHQTTNAFGGGLGLPAGAIAFDSNPIVVGFGGMSPQDHAKWIDACILSADCAHQYASIPATPNPIGSTEITVWSDATPPAFQVPVNPQRPQDSSIISFLGFLNSIAPSGLGVVPLLLSHNIHRGPRGTLIGYNAPFLNLIGGQAGATFGRIIIINPQYETPKLMDHEMVHVAQFEVLGSSFYPLYLLGYFYAYSQAPETAVQNNFLEKPAYAVGP
jgi:hypothetical protein